MKTVADRLKELREDSDLSQQQLAKEFGVSRSAIASYETGLVVPSVESLIKYADKFNASVDYLLCRVNQKNWTISEDDELKITHSNDLNIDKNQLSLIKTIIDTYLEDTDK